MVEQGSRKSVKGDGGIVYLARLQGKSSLIDHDRENGVPYCNQTEFEVDVKRALSDDR